MKCIFNRGIIEDDNLHNFVIPNPLSSTDRKKIIPDKSQEFISSSHICMIPFYMHNPARTLNLS